MVRLSITRKMYLYLLGLWQCSLLCIRHPCNSRANALSSLVVEGMEEKRGKRVEDEDNASPFAVAGAFSIASKGLYCKNHESRQNRPQPQ